MRRVLSAAILAALLPLSSGAQTYEVAQRYCAGRLIAERFVTAVTPGPQGRADYYVGLFNPGASQVEFRLQVTGDVVGRPTGLMTLAGGQRTQTRLGYALNVPGRQPLRNEQLAQATLISCI